MMKAISTMGYLNKLRKLVGKGHKHQEHTLYKYFTLYGVDYVFDIGANTGQSVKFYRGIGYCGKIISYEPIRSVWDQLQKNVSDDPECVPVNMGVSDSIGTGEIYVTDNGAVASSFLQMTQNVVDHAPEQRVVRMEKVETTTLEHELEKRYVSGDRAFLKIDVQGLEDTVLRSAGERLNQVVGMIVELSLVENYTGEILLYQQLPKLYDMGYRVLEIFPGWRNEETKELYQVDALLFRTERMIVPS